MTNEYSVDEMLRFYEETVKEIAKIEPIMKKGAKLAKESLKKKYPGNLYSSVGGSVAASGLFWNKAKHILHKYYPMVFTPPSVSQYRFEAPEEDHEITPNSKKKSFSGIMLELAATGFIPNLEVIKVFLNGDTPSARSFAAAVSNLKKSNYLTEKNAFGYEAVLVAPKETEEEKRQRIFNEKLAEIQKRHEADIEELKKQFLTK